MSTKMFFITADVTDGISHWNKSAVVCGSTIGTAYNAFLNTITDDCYVTEYGYTQLKLTSMHAGDIITHDTVACAVEKYKIKPDTDTEVEMDRCVASDDDMNMVHLNIDDDDDSDDEDDSDTSWGLDLGISEVSDCVETETHNKIRLLVANSKFSEEKFTESDEYHNGRFERYHMIRLYFALVPDWISERKKKKIERYILKHQKKIHHIDVYIRDSAMRDLRHYNDYNNTNDPYIRNLLDDISQCYDDDDYCVVITGFMDKKLKKNVAYLNLDEVETAPVVIY